MIDFNTSQVRGHRQNIERYCRLLATELTDPERQYPGCPRFLLK